MTDFYLDTIRALVRDGTLATNQPVLVAAGGPRDRDVLQACGFRDAVISNLDERVPGAAFAPYEWSFQDAERLDYPDGAFDACIVHNGLHHCASPHRALLELYRVSRRVVVAFEPLDTWITRLGVRLGVGQRYETAAVFDNGMTAGGVRNSEIPNFVYRWTEDEVRKTIESYAPIGRHGYRFHYATRVPWGSLRLLKRRRYLALAVVALPAFRLLGALYPRVANNFAFVIEKPGADALHPWIDASGGAPALDRRWLEARYGR